VSGSVAQEGIGAVTTRERRMNTAPEYHLRFVCVASLQLKMRNGMEEVVGSIPTRSTKSPNNLDRASDPLHITLRSKARPDSTNVQIAVAQPLCKKGRNRWAASAHHD